MNSFMKRQREMVDSNHQKLSGNSAPVTLTGNLGTSEIVFTVLAYNAPLTVVVGFIGLLVSLGNGLGAPLAFVVAGGLMLLFAVGFTTMSRHVPNAGAFYAYITAGLGRPLGFGSALVAMLAYGFMLFGMYLYAGFSISLLIKHLFSIEPLVWWAYSLVMLLIVSVFGYVRITLSARVLTLALALEVILVVVWMIFVIVSKPLTDFSPHWLTASAFTSGSLGIGMLLAVTCFAGFEATAVFREEARAPEKTIPRATYGAILVLLLLFSTASYVLICAYGPENVLIAAKADASSLAMNSVGAYLGEVGLEIINVLLCTSIFAALLALHNILARYMYSMGMDGTFPRALAAVHKKHGSPCQSSLVVSAIMLLAIIVAIAMNASPYDGYAIFVGVGGYCLLMLLVLTSLAVLAFFARSKVDGRFWNTKLAPFLSFVLLATVGWLATTNMDVLVGNVRVAIIMLGVVFGSLIVGSLYAWRLKATRPHIYTAIGRQLI